ncbi:MAG: ArsR family transcriptional regulator, partial [Steroidobacteraceae bacterium]
MLFSAPDGKTYLIDMDGHVRHMWNYSGMPAKMLDPSLIGDARGEIGVQLKLVPAGGHAITLVPGQEGQFADETFGYVNWKGEVVWQWGTEA